MSTKAWELSLYNAEATVPVNPLFAVSAQEAIGSAGVGVAMGLDGLITLTDAVFGGISSLGFKVGGDFGEVPSTTVFGDAAAEVHPDIPAAQQDQINSGYNPDSWTMTTVPKGSLVYGGLPGQSAYYTTEQTLLDGSYDSATIFDSLQVAPHPEFGYRPEMGVYQVLEDTQVPNGQAMANPQIGTGGAEQYFFGNYGQQLQLVGRIPLGK